MLKSRICALAILTLSAPLFAELRSFETVFPGLPAEIRTAVFSEGGYIKSSEIADFSLIGGDDGARLDPRIRSAVLDTRPPFVVEALRVIPLTPNTAGLLEVYNALGKIRALKGRPYFSETRQKQIPLFEDAARLESAKKNTPVPDPAPAAAVPLTETVYIRLKDANFGNCYYAISFTTNRQGILYRIQNFRALSFGPIPVMKARAFTALFYLEPVEEGLALYCLVGAEVSDFIGRHVDMPSSLDKRLNVLIEWLLDGLR